MNRLADAWLRFYGWHPVTDLHPARPPVIRYRHLFMPLEIRVALPPCEVVDLAQFRRAKHSA